MKRPSRPRGSFGIRRPKVDTTAEHELQKLRLVNIPVVQSSLLLTLPRELHDIILEYIGKDSRALCSLTLGCRRLYQLYSYYRLRHLTIQCGIEFERVLVEDPNPQRRQGLFGWKRPGLVLIQFVKENPPMYHSHLNKFWHALGEPNVINMVANVEDLTITDHVYRSNDIESALGDRRSQVQIIFILRLISMIKSLYRLVLDCRFTLPGTFINLLKEQHPRVQLHIKRWHLFEPPLLSSELHQHSFGHALLTSPNLKMIRMASAAVNFDPELFSQLVQQAPNLTMVQFDDSSKYMQLGLVDGYQPLENYFQDVPDELSKIGHRNKFIKDLRISGLMPHFPTHRLWYHLDLSRLRSLDLTHWKPLTHFLNPSLMTSLTKLGVCIRETSGEERVFEFLRNCTLESLILIVEDQLDPLIESPKIITELLQTQQSSLRSLCMNWMPCASDLYTMGKGLDRLEFLGVETIVKGRDLTSCRILAKMSNLRYLRIKVNDILAVDNDETYSVQPELQSSRALVKAIWHALIEDEPQHQIRKVAACLDSIPCNGNPHLHISTCVLDATMYEHGRDLDDYLHSGYDLVGFDHQGGSMFPALDDGLPLVHTEDALIEQIKLRGNW